MNKLLIGSMLVLVSSNAMAKWTHLSSNKEDVCQQLITYWKLRSSKMKCYITLFILLFSTQANSMNGNGFVLACENDKSNNAEFVCMAYLQAGIDSVLNAQNTFQSFSEEIKKAIADKMTVSCMPQIETYQAKMIVLKWYRDKPDKLNNFAISEIIPALQKSFPCK